MTHGGGGRKEEKGGGGGVRWEDEREGHKGEEKEKEVRDEGEERRVEMMETENAGDKDGEKKAERRWDKNI